VTGQLPKWAAKKRTVNPGDGRVAAVYETVCAGCGAVVTTKGGTNNIELVRRNLSAKGWAVVGDTARCPECVKKLMDRRSGGGKDAMTEQPRGANDRAPGEPTVEEAARIVRKINEVFDDGRYLDGWTDRKIATALAIAPAKVTRAREMFIGPIKEDPAIAALRSEVEAVEDMLRGIKERLAALAEAA